jgi:hypothetical protein
MMNTRLSEELVNAQAKIVGGLLDNGFMDFYDGAQPDGPEAVLMDQVFFGSVRFAGFTDPKGGIIYAFPITDGVAIETGKISWARCFQSDHKTVVMDMSVGQRDCNITVKSSEVERGTVIEVTAFEYEVPPLSPGM